MAERALLDVLREALQIASPETAKAAIDALIEEKRLGRIPDGMPGIRDVDNPCADFQPGAPAGRCEGDGHYICHECTERELVHFCTEALTFSTMIGPTLCGTSGGVAWERCDVTCEACKARLQAGKGVGREYVRKLQDV